MILHLNFACTTFYGSSIAALAIKRSLISRYHLNGTRQTWVTILNSRTNFFYFSLTGKLENGTNQKVLRLYEIILLVSG